MPEPLKTKRPVVMRDGQAVLRDAAGNFYQVAPDAADRLVLSGEYQAPTEDEVRARDRAREVEKQGVGGQVQAGAEAATAGLMDVLTSVPRAVTAAGAAVTGRPDPLKDVSGRQFVQNLAELTGANPKQYAEEARGREEFYPGTETVARIGAQLPFGGVAGRIGGVTRLGQAAAGAAEGAALGAVQAGEDAYLDNVPLTAEQTLAAMGWGAIAGGAVGGLLPGAGPVRAAEAEAPTFAVPKALTPYRTTAESVEAVAGRALGAEPAPGLGQALGELWNDKILKGYGKAAAVKTGGDESFIRQAMAASPEGRAVRQTLRDAPKILEDATTTLTDDVGHVIGATGDVTEEVVESALKRSHVQRNLARSELDETASLGAAQRFSSNLRAEIEDIAANPDVYGTAGVKNLKKWADDLDFAVQNADATGAYMAVDQARRGLLTRFKSVSQSAQRSTDPLAIEQLRRMAPKLQDNYLRAANFLMDDAVWGAQGAAQKRANLAWVEYIKAKDAAFGSVATRTSRDMAGNWEYVADPAKIARRVRDIGRAEGKLADDQFRQFISASRGLADAIGEGYELAPEKLAAVKQLRAAADRIGGTLGKADKTVRLVNQLDELDRMSRSTGVSIPLLGGLTAGPAGALGGAAWSAVSNPAALIRTMGAIEAMRKNVDSKIAEGIKGFFAKHSAKRLPSGGVIEGAKKLTGKVAGAAKATGRTAKAAAIPAAVTFAAEGEKPRAAYKRRVQEVITLASGTGEAMRARAQAALGDHVAAGAPKLAGFFSDQAMQGAAFLVSKLPAGIIEPNTLQPKLSDTHASSTEIAEFARYWQAVANPLSMLDELKRGTLTHEHVEALKFVYPQMYANIRERVMDEIAAQREALPLQAVIKLDLLLDLQGAGEPTLEPGFQVRFGEYMQQAAQQKQQAPSKPITEFAPKFSTRQQTLESPAGAGRS